MDKMRGLLVTEINPPFSSAPCQPWPRAPLGECHRRAWRAICFPRGWAATPRSTAQHATTRGTAV